VRLIAADLVADKRSGLQYCSVRIGFAEGELQRLSVSLLPGMPVETFAQTSSRTVLSYLTRPLWDEIFRAFRED
jgi:HlyD family secretion protein